MQIGLHYQVKLRWVSGQDSLPNITGVWTRLCGYFLSRHEDDICVDHNIIGNNLLLAISSVGHQKCLTQWYSW